MIDIPPSFARGIVEREGDSAQAWVQSLPRLVDEILQRWRCTPTERIVGGGVGIILAVHRHDGSPAVVKVSFPHPGNVYEPHAFATWGGRQLAIFSDAAEVDRERVTRWVQARTAIGAHHSRKVGDPAWAIHLLERTAEFLAR